MIRVPSPNPADLPFVLEVGRRARTAVCVVLGHRWGASPPLRMRGRVYGPHVSCGRCDVTRVLTGPPLDGPEAIGDSYTTSDDEAWLNTVEPELFPEAWR